MKKFLLVLFVIFFVNNSISKPTNFDYDTYRNIADDGVYVNVSPSEIDGDGDSNNSDFFDSAEIVKREIHFNNNKSSLMPIQKFSESVEHFNLSDIIYRIEKAFLTTASNLIQTFTNTLNTNETIIIDLSKFKKNSTDSNDDDDNNNNNSSDENRSFISFVHKIQKREISENIVTTETINSSSSEEVSNSDESQKLAKIAIYPNVGYFPLIPKFDFRLLKRNAKKEIKLSSSDNGNNVVITDANSISTTTVTEKTTTSEKLLLTRNNTTSTSSSSSSSSSSSTTTSTTTKDPIKELKENEKDVKEKIAEIEAEPVILSSRI